MYPYYTPFTNNELRKHIGLYMVHRLAPLPQVSIKFTSQEQDEINGNYFVKRSLEPADTRLHKHFRHFFATQCPVKPSPTRSYKPNWKLDPFLEWIKSLSQKAWKLGENISVDEQTCGFQCRHPYKLRITYKNQGDKFQGDALCDNVYTFTLYFRHEPPLENYTKQGISPFYARVMYLFDSCDNEYHICGVDHLYMSTKFCIDSFNHNKKIKLHGVTKNSGRGIPDFVLQEEVQNKAQQEKVRGTVCAA